ncbi:dihydrodipicolinate synthase family protein [Paenibacillus antri]|uniref:Dihydrodipicolinate synthase family protein n=1 Tax=Paenibacillus antri TaxID=2582848 RepID=A0A5R9G662_9BACL|nr:dihydrodipicolinate synthase family protein [Paenibacillus antri]TLS51862.1 dihydrodipicolinate synthase family protein [Paenibacillus antri]
MKPEVPNGIWPTMVTPFTASGSIDYDALEMLIEWYIAHGSDGLFAVCQSSEMFYLSLEERVALAKFVVEKADGRLPVIASGHISDRADDQVEELGRIASTGVDAVVLVSNRLAAREEDDEVWKRNAEYILERVPEVQFGIYECPYPYKRLLSPELLRWCADTGRFSFLKDTCCDVEQMREKLEAVRGSRLKLFNANSSTLLESLKLGAAGFSGVMANFHLDLYAYLVKRWRTDPAIADAIQAFLGVVSLVELQYYPVNAKYHLQLSGVPLQLRSRVSDETCFKPNQKLEIEQLQVLTSYVRERLKSNVSS